MFAIYKKELRSFFVNPIGYIYCGVFLVFAALCCCYTTIINKTYNTSAYFSTMLYAFAVLLPLLTMRSFAEERKMKTEQLLLTSPVTITGMVFGKFLAALTVYVGTMIVSLVNLIPIYVLGAEERGNVSYAIAHIGPYTPQVLGQFFGLLLLGAAFLAVGLLISSMAENQLSAAVITIAVNLGLLLINIINNATDSDGEQLITSYPVRFVFNWVSVMDRYSVFAGGQFDLSGFVYFASIAFIFLFLTIRVYEKRRWG